MADQISPLSSEPHPASIDKGSKSRRTVRMFTQSHLDQSDDDVVAPAPLADDREPPPHPAALPTHPRAASYPGPSTSPTNATRLGSIPTAPPKLVRAATYSRATTSNSLASTRSSTTAASAPPPTAGPSNYLLWKSRYRPNRVPSLRSKGKARDEMTYRLDLNDADGYTHALDDWASDDEDDDTNPAQPRPVKAMVADAVRMATAKSDDPIGPPGVDLSRIGVGLPKSLILASPPPDAAGPETAEGRERLEWQSMLASVLGGDILKGESSRIGVERPSNETYRKALGLSLWWQIRARVRDHSEEEEKRRVGQRRSRVVDAVLEEIEHFSVAADGEVAAIDQVEYILQKLSVIESLYPHQHSFRIDKPLYNSEAFQSRVDALSAWSTAVTQLKAQVNILQKWTGADDLDITRPNTTMEKALVGNSRYHPLDAKARAHAQNVNDLAADNSTFVDRVLKEDSLQRTFEKRIFTDQLAAIQNAKETVIAHSPLFAELKLPDFQYELVRLIAFPSRLITEALNTRLRAAERLVDPNIMVIDDMIDSFRISISLAILIRRQYEEIVAPDPENRWTIPECLPLEYNEVLLSGIKTFFKLLHWKLKSGSKAVFYRETEVLEDEWEFLYEAAEAVEGGDLVVAESLCSLTNKLMVRVINYFETSLHVPVSVGTKIPAAVEGKKQDHRVMTTEEMLVWFGKILDAIKMRYRKLQRFARRLTQRFDNSAEYLLEDNDTDLLVEQLHESGHFLVYTSFYEEQGTYIFADGALWERPSAVRQLLFRAFSASVPNDHRQRRRQDDYDHGGLSNGEDEGDDQEDDAEYLLLVSPRQNFAWTGAVMTLEVDKPVELGLDDSRVRLIADGPMHRLNYCKLLFTRALIDPATSTSIISLECIIEQQAHLPKVQKELKKIARSAHRLSEYIIESAAHVRRTLRGAPGTQDLIETWYLFASDHGHRVGVHMDHLLWARFSRLLMRLAISWVSFICDNCDPTDRKTFRWTVNALEYAMLMTRGNNILHLDKGEFALLRAKVANCMTLLISHFDILGARSSIEAKKEAERVETLRRMQRLHEREDDDDGLLPRTPSPSGVIKVQVDRSLRISREVRLRLISELEQQRAGLSSDQHLIGQVLDEEVSEDRALVFLAASSSNISLRWQQGGFIGGGANGSVYLGFNLDSGGIMAVKEIRVQDLTNSPALYKQIKDEADVMQMLSHPNIVDYYGIEVHRDRVYIFEEYCPGGSLANLLEHGRVEDEDVIMVYAWQMLQGLQYLHSKGVEHRDVKPDNILLGSNSVLKFVDFGAAKVIIKGHRTMARTRAITKSRATGAPAPDAGPAVMNSLAGTPMYLAPEVIKGGSGQLGSADIWSMGCVVLEVTTGRKPWSNLDNEWAIMFHIGIATQHPPLPEPGQLSELGIDFIEQCLTLDPDKRPSSAELLHHPWLAPMMDMQGISSPSIPSVTSTLVDHGEAYAAQLAELAKAAVDATNDQIPNSEELASLSSTPAVSTPSGQTP